MRYELKRYAKHSLLLLTAIFLLTLLGIRVYGTNEMIMPLALCTIFHLVANMAYGAMWGKIAESSVQSLPTLYLIASGVRMFAAIVTVMAYCFIEDDKTLIKFFAIVFMVFYFIMLIYDTAFFVGVEKKSKK